MTDEGKQKIKNLGAKIKESPLFNISDIVGIIGLLIGMVVYFFVFKTGWWVWLLFLLGVIALAFVLEIVTGHKPVTAKNSLLSFMGISLKLILELLFLCTFVPYLAVRLLGRFLFFAAAVCSLMAILIAVHHGLLFFGIKWLSPPPELITLNGFLLQVGATALSLALGMLYLKVMGIDEEKPMDLFFGFWVKLYQRSQRYIDGWK